MAQRIWTKFGQSFEVWVMLNMFQYLPSNQIEEILVNLLEKGHRGLACKSTSKTALTSPFLALHSCIRVLLVTDVSSYFGIAEVLLPCSEAKLTICGFLSRTV